MSLRFARIQIEPHLRHFAALRLFLVLHLRQMNMFDMTASASANLPMMFTFYKNDLAFSFF
jgi:hypothetical protein